MSTGLTLVDIKEKLFIIDNHTHVPFDIVHNYDINYRDNYSHDIS